MRFLAQNLLAPRLPRVPALTLNRIAVLVVAAAAVVIAFLGESAYSLLEDAYDHTDDDDSLVGSLLLRFYAQEPDLKVTIPRVPG